MLKHVSYLFLNNVIFQPTLFWDGESYRKVLYSPINQLETEHEWYFRKAIFHNSHWVMSIYALNLFNITTVFYNGSSLPL